ncbi:uncharacterized protein TM35_000062730 [Trypanosoma theileri]|uniref:Uncharacterized protein n=1 Tax=Trypanosoma theileri TaxID=67003 RepID=A0A1X0P375_9TRYP|nr:uncharacterized protein TM35_000062730 [Trypanosoma theileri]ORC91268.1 hypothetical protein TM35_000062730 [Trypanosoma theileri]
MVKQAEGVTKKIVNLTKSIEAITTRGWDGEQGERKTVLRLKSIVDKDKFEELLRKANEVLRETENEVPTKDAVSKIDEAEHLKLMCTGIRKEVDYTLNALKEAIKSYDYLDVNYSGNALAMEVKNAGEEIRDVLQNVTNVLGNVTVQNRFSVGEAKGRLEAWKKAYAELKLVGEMHEVKVMLPEEVKSFVEGKRVELEALKSKVEGPKKVFDNRTDRKNKETEARRNTTIEEVDKRLKEANAAELLLMEEEKKKIAEDDKRRAEEERRRVEEEKARLAAEEKRMLDEEKAKMEEKKRVAEEAERKKAADKARLAKEEQERSAKQEEAKRAKEEEAKRAAEKAKKKKDGSSRPALVLSSLVPLLLFVLGCTLVC